MDVDRPRISAASARVKPGEDAELDELGLDRVLGGELLEGLVEGQQVVVGLGRGGLGGVEVYPAAVAAALEPVSPPGVLDQDPPHGLGRRGEEVAASVPGPVGIDADQPQVRLVHQRRGLERLPGRLPRHPLRGQPPQLVVDQGQQLASRSSALRGRVIPGRGQPRRDRLRWMWSSTVTPMHYLVGELLVHDAFQEPDRQFALRLLRSG